MGGSKLDEGLILCMPDSVLIVSIERALYGQEKSARNIRKLIQSRIPIAHRLGRSVLRIEFDSRHRAVVDKALQSAEMPVVQSSIVLHLLETSHPKKNSRRWSFDMNKLSSNEKKKLADLDECIRENFD